MRVVLSRKARADLADIGAYIAEDDPIRAEGFIAELANAAFDLTTFPERFPLVPRYARHRMRRRRYGNYLVIYRIDPDRILVLRFLHAARDYESLLDPGN